MSGGVDSSTSAILLKKQGNQVIGATLLLSSGTKAVEQAVKVCSKLKIPHYIFDFRKIFKEKVINYFIQEYQKGGTPNPCVKCNQYIKFGVLLKEGRKMGMDYLATGHYARIKKDKDKYYLYKAKDKTKDQSYFLYRLKQDQLKDTLFPLGDLMKEEVRKLAKKFSLPIIEGSESQEICFIDKEYKKFFKENVKQIKKGPILDKQGNVLGQHQGIVFYTIGQRRGIKIAGTKPFYVININAKKNAIIAGEEKDLYKKELIAKDLNWIIIKKLDKLLKVKAKIRYLHQGAEAVICPFNKNRVRVKFKRSQRAITPGQSIVFYQKDKVIGGGIIN